MRCIDADALIEFIENRYDITWKEDYEGGIKDACVDILEEINKMPTIELEIVRCKDCEYGKQDEDDWWYCISFGCQVGDEDGSGFCADAERRK